MSKRKKLTALEQQIQSLTSNIKTIDELEDLTPHPSLLTPHSSLLT